MAFIVSDFVYFLTVYLFVSSGGLRVSSGARFVVEPNDERVKTGAKVTLVWIFEDPEQHIENGQLFVSLNGRSNKLLFSANPSLNKSESFATEVFKKRAHVGLAEPLKQGNVSVRMVISNVTTADTGIYTFKVTHLLESFANESKISLYVTEKPHSLQINNTGSIVTEVGKSLYLKCQVSGAPVPEVAWFSGSSELQSGTGVAILSLNKITKETEGSYICKGNNTEGEVQDSIFINVTYLYLNCSKPFVKDGKQFVLFDAVGNPNPSCTLGNATINCKGGSVELTRTKSDVTFTARNNAGLEKSCRRVAVFNNPTNRIRTDRSTATPRPTGNASLISYSVTLLTALQLITSMM